MKPKTNRRKGTNKHKIYTFSIIDKELYDTIVSMKEIYAEEMGLRRITWDDFFKKAFKLDEVEE